MTPSNAPSTAPGADARQDRAAPCYPAVSMTATATPPPPGRRIRHPVLLAIVASLLIFAAPADRHMRAASLLLRFADAKATGFVAEYRTHALTETDTSFPSAGGEVRARLYTPSDV